MIWDMGLRNRVVPISTGHRSIPREWKSAKRDFIIGQRATFSHVKKAGQYCGALAKKLLASSAKKIV